MLRVTTSPMTHVKLWPKVKLEAEAFFDRNRPSAATDLNVTWSMFAQPNEVFMGAAAPVSGGSQMDKT